MTSTFKTCALLLGAATLFACAWLGAAPHALAPFASQPAAPTADTPPAMAAHFASSDLEDFVHSAFITGLPGGDLMAAWFAGSREGAADVQIRAARFDAANGQWSAERVLATRESTQRAVGKHIRKLGNPVINLAPDNRLWLFYVSVSLGGWAGSAVNAMASDDLGETWSAPRQLVTSPFLNISTLVRAAPVFHADGSIGLPVYHEFLGKFPEYLHLSAAGEVLGKYRIGAVTRDFLVQMQHDGSSPTLHDLRSPTPRDNVAEQHPEEFQRLLALSRGLHEAARLQMYRNAQADE